MHGFNFYKLMGFDNGNFMHLSPPTRNRTFPSPKTFFMLLSSQSHPATQTYLLICSLSLKIRFACFGLHTKGIIENKRFSVSFLSHNNITLGDSYVLFLIFNAQQHAPINLSILSPTDGLLGCFQYLPVNEATVNVLVQVFLQTYVFNSPWLGLELYCKYMLNFMRNY